MAMFAKLRPARRGSQVRPGFRPMMDTFEARQLLTAVSPVLQGTVFADSNGNGSLDTTESPLAGAKVNIYAANSTTSLGQVTTGADGNYLFTNSNVTGGLLPGNTYTLVESASGYSNTGAQAISQINPATVTAPNTIQVTVVNPNTLVASYAAPTIYPGGLGGYNQVYYTQGGVSDNVNVAQLNFSLSGDPNVLTNSFPSLCVGVNDSLSRGTSFQPQVDPTGALLNGGQIAYLYNHYGLTTLPNATPLPTAIQSFSTRDVASGLQIAIWELEYGNSFVLTGYNPDHTTAQDYADLQTAAATFIADSVGKSEQVAILDASLTGGLPTPSVIPNGQSVLAGMSYNFGNKLIPVGSLAGVIYADANNNGSKDSSEAGLGSIAVSLTQTVGGVTTVIATGTTNPDGSYSFTGLLPGSYSVVEGVVAGYLPSSTNTGSLKNITVTAGANTPNNNFGEILPGVIKGVVYADGNNNGVKDGTETGIGSIPLTLTQTVGGVTTTIATMTTNTDGSYTFANLAPGTYTVVEGKVTGYLPSTTNTGSLGGITITQGATSPNNNFGEILPGTITGFVYADATNNGIKDGTDKGVGSIPVSLTQTVGGVTTVVATTTTNPDGSYSFTNLAPGTYAVVEGKAGAYLPSITNTGSVTGVTVAQGATVSNVNFGEILPGSLSGVVYADGNNNGVKDGTETGIGSIPLTLTQVVGGKTTTIATMTTNPDGSYSFTNLAPGTYTVVEGAVTGYLPSVSNTGSLPGVTVTQGANNPNNNFGEILPASISGVVFTDKTGDGLSGEDTPLSGVTVQLVNSAGVVIASQKVGTDGAYSFGNLAPGSYTVKEVVPTGYVQTGPSSLTYTVPLAGGQTVTGDNFDNYQLNCCCAISNISYTDVGPNGTSTLTSLRGNTNQGDQVTVNFTVGGTSPATVSFVTYVATSNFDLTKQTIFSVDTQTFAPGPHSLTVTIPNSYYQIDFVCGSAIAQFNPGANITYHGEGRFIDADNGGSEVIPTAFASLAGSVFVDNNYDGNFGATDSGLGGVTIKLTGKDVNGQNVTLTRITGKDGSYNFTGLQPGTYKVAEVTPSGYFTTKDSIGTVGGKTNGSLASSTADAITAITLAGGNTGVAYNFGEQVIGSALGCNQTASTCFWNGCSGQNLIKSLNGGSTATSLGNWLAAEFPNSLSSLAGKTNAQVASFYQSAYSQCRYSSLTEGLATALAVYATDSGLAGGNYAACYGLKVTAAGAGAATYDVGTTFACYGGPQGKVTLLQLLMYADANAGNCDAWFQYRLACVFDAINGCGNY